MTISSYLFFLLLIVLSLDAFAAGLSYGIEKVQVPFLSALIIALLSGSVLTLSLLAGDLLLDMIPPVFAKGLSFFVLFLLSLYKFYDAMPRDKNGFFTTGTISQRVNRKDTEILSLKEAVLLAFALSIDNVSAGLCTGTIPLPQYALLLLTCLIHFAAIRSGLFVGQLLRRKGSHHFTWIGAAILMVLALCRLF